MPRANDKLGGRWIQPGESPFGRHDSVDNQARRAWTDPKKERNAQWTEYLNRRAQGGRRFPKP